VGTAVVTVAVAALLIGTFVATEAAAVEGLEDCWGLTTGTDVEA
jgi:hypothetical protein